MLRSLAGLTGRAELLVVVPEESPFTTAPPLTDENLTWITTPCPGKYEALCRGVAAARGDILIFLDADIVPHPGALRLLVDALTTEDIDIAAGRIVVGRRDGGPIQRTLRFWMEISVASWHLLRSDHPELRWALPGAMYAMRRDWFPADGLLVPILDDASIGIRSIESGARIGYVPEAEVNVEAPRRIRQWFRQKLRTRRAWRALRDLRPAQVAALQSELTRNRDHLIEGNYGARFLRILDDMMTVYAENSRPSRAERLGVWQPDRSGSKHTRAGCAASVPAATSAGDTGAGI